MGNSYGSLRSTAHLYAMMNTSLQTQIVKGMAYISSAGLSARRLSKDDIRLSMAGDIKIGQ